MCIKDSRPVFRTNERQFYVELQKKDRDMNLWGTFFTGIGGEEGGGERWQLHYVTPNARRRNERYNKMLLYPNYHRVAIYPWI